MQAEKKTLQKAVEHLNNDAPLRTLALTETKINLFADFDL